MSRFEQLPKGSILYIKAKDLLSMNGNNFVYPGATSDTVAAPGPAYPSAVASRNFLSYSSKDSENVFRRVTEHNRQEFSLGNNRLEQSVRMANGTLRKYVVADKKTFNLSWTMLPSYRNLTVDGAWAAEDLKTFYESQAGQKQFDIKINSSFSSTTIENEALSIDNINTFTVVFTNCNFSIIKRGLQTFWNVDISMEQV